MLFLFLASIVMRWVQMPSGFAKALRDAVHGQMDPPFDREKRQQLAAAVEGQYSVQELCRFLQYTMRCGAVKSSSLKSLHPSHSILSSGSLSAFPEPPICMIYCIRYTRSM